MVDSINTISPFFSFFETIFIASSKLFKSGFLSLLTGVGTQIIKKFDFINSSEL